MKIKEIRAMPKAELEKKLKELRKDLIKENAQISTGTTQKNPSNARNIKKTIAKILSILKQLEVVKKHD